MTNGDVRIVSLIPSGTEILAELGLLDVIVGRSHECDYPPEILDRPICTQARLNSDTSSGKIHDQVNNLLQSALSIYQIREIQKIKCSTLLPRITYCADRSTTKVEHFITGKCLKIDVLEKLQPTHIVTQDQCDVCAVTLADVEKAVATLTHSSPQIISLQPNVLKDLWADIERVANVFQVNSQYLLENLEARVKIVEQKTKGLSQIEHLPNVACIEWTEPLMVAANWIPELVSLAGGKPIFGVTGQPSASLQWEMLLATNPDVIIFMPCGLDLNRTRQEAQLLAHRPDWQKIHANQSGRVYIVDGNSYFNRPGPRLIDSLEIMAEILHPEIFEYGYKGKAWEPL
jgi:iron complex transport system substrate-binding protein